jgi:hypothetical protein
VNGEGVEGVAGDVKEAGRAGTEGGVVVEALGVVVGTAEDGVGTVEGEATAAIEPLRSHGFGGEPIRWRSSDQMQLLIFLRQRRDDGKTRGG